MKQNHRCVVTKMGVEKIVVVIMKYQMMIVFLAIHIQRVFLSVQNQSSIAFVFGDYSFYTKSVLHIP